MQQALLAIIFLNGTSGQSWAHEINAMWILKAFTLLLTLHHVFQMKLTATILWIDTKYKCP